MGVLVPVTHRPEVVQTMEAVWTAMEDPIGAEMRVAGEDN